MMIFDHELPTPKCDKRRQKHLPKLSNNIKQPKKWFLGHLGPFWKKNNFFEFFPIFRNMLPHGFVPDPFSYPQNTPLGPPKCAQKPQKRLSEPLNLPKNGF